jgi:hypothetical protein
MNGAQEIQRPVSLKSKSPLTTVLSKGTNTMKIIKVKHFSTREELDVFVDKSISKGRSLNISQNFLGFVVTLVK